MTRILITPLLFLISTALFGAQSSKVTLKTSAATVEYGHPVTFTAVVRPAAATGKVTFYSGVTVLETEPLVSGTATLTTTLLPFGAPPVTAYYTGDANYNPSTSAAVVETVKTSLARSFAEPLLSGSGDCYGPVAVGDFNGDAKPDLAVANDCGVVGLSVFIGNGDGTFQEPVNYPDSADNYAVGVGDFNGDGKADIAVGYAYGGAVLLGNGDGTFQPPVSIYFQSGFYNLAIADFNDDGNADLASTGDGGIIIAFGNGNGTFQTPVAAISGEFESLVLGDFNGDGKVDVATTTLDESGTLELEVFLGNGDGTFQPAIVSAAPPSPSSFATGDFNEDGKVDLAVNTPSGVAILLGNGDGTFQPPVFYGAGPAKYIGAVEVSDVNGDGKADVVSIIYRTNSTDVIQVLLGNGDGTFQSPRDSAAEMAGDFIENALADLNGDGKADLVEALSSAMSVQLGSALGPTFTTLTSSLSSSTFGEPVTLTASVLPAASSGTVTFYDKSTEIGTAKVSSGIATLTVSTLSLGPNSLTAAYSGTQSEVASYSPAVLVKVAKSPSSATLFASPNPATRGQTVTLTADVAPAQATGSVTFYDGAAALQTVSLTNGQAKMSTSTLSEGQHSLSATYFGNTDYDASVSSTVIETVN